MAMRSDMTRFHRVYFGMPIEATHTQMLSGLGKKGGLSPQMPEELCHEIVGRLANDLVGTANLLQLSLMEDRDAAA